ncbi:hypothetical protein ACHWQZ_G010867 [Mnemiopsis leidyi]
MNNGYVKVEGEDKVMIGMPSQPHTPAGTSLPESQTKPPALSMEQILASIEKVDRDIVDMDRTVKKVNSELAKQENVGIPGVEVVPVNPRKTEISENVNLIQKIYEENKIRAQQTSMSMLHLGCPLLEPRLPGLALYKQPSDLPQYHAIVKNWKEGTFKKALVEYLWKKKQETDAKEKQLAEEYDSKYVIWQEKLKILEENPKRQKDLLQCRKYFETMFPTIKRKLEQEDRFNRARSWGNAVRSEAELAEIVEQLTEHQESEDKHLECAATTPHMILSPVEKARRFYNENGREFNPAQQHKSHILTVHNTWTDAEKLTFREKFGQHGKVFHKIAASIPTKNVAQCVHYYYLSKKKENYKALLPKKKRKGIVPPKDVAQNISTPLSPATPRITRSKRVENEAETGKGWNEQDIDNLKDCLRKLGKNWNKIAKEIPNKTAAQVKHYFHNHRKRLSLDDCLKNPLLIHSQKEQKSKADSEVSDESESNIDDFDVDPNVMSNVNAVIENGVLEGNNLKIESDSAAILKTLDEIENSRDAEVRSIATSIATSHSESCNTLPPLEPHHDNNLPRPTTPDVIAMVSSLQEECAPTQHPPPPPLHNPAANPPPLFSHTLPPQMPQIGAARGGDVGQKTPPSMKRWNKYEADENKTPTPDTQTPTTPTPSTTTSTYKNLPRLTAKSHTGEEAVEEGAAQQQAATTKRKYVLRTGPGRKTKEKFVKIEEGEKIASSDDDLGEKALKTMMLNRSQKEGYTILTPVETKDNMGNPIKIAGWIGESHVRGAEHNQPDTFEVKDKVITPKKKEKGSVDKKSSVFKVYDFDSSEDEPVSKTTEKKRAVGRIPTQSNHSNHSNHSSHVSHVSHVSHASHVSHVSHPSHVSHGAQGNDPIAAHFTNKIGNRPTRNSVSIGGSETDDAEESEEAKKKVSRPSSSSSSCDLPLCYDMSDETNMSQANPSLEGETKTPVISRHEEKQPSIRKTILKSQQDLSAKQQQQQVHSILKKENGPPVSIPVAASGTLPSGTLAPGTLPPGSVSASPSGGPTGAHPGPTSVMSEEMVSLLASNPHLAQALSSISIPVSHQSKQDALRYLQTSMGQHAAQQQAQRNVMRLKPSVSPNSVIQTEGGYLKNKTKESIVRSAAAGQQYVQMMAGYTESSRQQHPTIRTMPTARVLQSDKRPISGSGSSAFSQFKSGSIIPRTEGLSSIIRSRDQRSLVSHLTEQQKHRTPEQHRYSSDRQRLAEQSRTLAEQQRSLAEAQQRTLLEQRAAGLTEAQQRSLLEHRGAGLTEAQLRGLTVSGLTDMQALQHVARSMTESQQQAVARSIAESQQHVDAARQQRLLHQELAAALAQHTQSPNQLQQIMQQQQQQQQQQQHHQQQQQQMRALTDQMVNPELLVRSSLPALLQQLSSQQHFKSSGSDQREIERRLEALRKQQGFIGSGSNMYMPRFYVPSDMIPIPSSMYSHNNDTNTEGEK